MCQFGDMSISKMAVAQFQGMTKTTSTKASRLPKSARKDDQVKSSQAALTALRRVAKSPDSSPESRAWAKEGLKAWRANAAKVRATTKNILRRLGLGPSLLKDGRVMELTQHDCYYPLVEAYHKHCYGIGRNEIAIREVRQFVNYCELGHDSELALRAIREECAPEPVLEIVD